MKVRLETIEWFPELNTNRNVMSLSILYYSWIPYKPLRILVLLAQLGCPRSRRRRDPLESGINHYL